jgi:hypothetical protein
MWLAFPSLFDFGGTSTVMEKFVIEFTCVMQHGYIYFTIAEKVSHTCRLE